MPRVRRCRYPGCHTMVKLPDHYCREHYEHEAEYLAIRQRWARTHGKSYQHKYNTQTRHRDDTKSTQYHFYRTKHWQSLRREVLDRDHYICQYCGRPNSKTVDHIVPIEYDEALKASADNLATICRKCHRLKTDWEHEWYGTGQGNELQSVTPINDLSAITVLMNEE